MFVLSNTNKSRVNKNWHLRLTEDASVVLLKEGNAYCAISNEAISNGCQVGIVFHQKMEHLVRSGLGVALGSHYFPKA
jgi:hypothetical protein